MPDGLQGKHPPGESAACASRGERCERGSARQFLMLQGDGTSVSVSLMTFPEFVIKLHIRFLQVNDL